MTNLIKIIDTQLKKREFTIKNGKLVDSKNNIVYDTKRDNLSLIGTKTKTTISL